MSIVYINLHPQYNYAMAMIQGYIPELKDYVKNVDWLSWDRSRKRQIMISGDKEKDHLHHLNLANIFAQRMRQLGIEVKIRNERTDDWEDFQEKDITTEYMISIECERTRGDNQRDQILETIKKDKEYLNLAIAKNSQDSCSLYADELKWNEKRLNDYDAKEIERINAIKSIMWSKDPCFYNECN